MVSTNTYINVLKHQYMILYFCSDRIREGDDARGVKRDRKLMNPMGTTFSHCAKALSASTVPLAYCPK